MLTESIKEKISELSHTIPSNIGVAYGKKITNNKFTGEKGILFFVENKLPLSEIPENDVLPSSVIIDDKEYPTDVITSGKFSALACDPSCYTWQTVPPLNRNIIRPLKGGIAMNTDNTFQFVGTFGFIAVDVATQALVGVTNNHVTNKDCFYTYYRNNVNGPISNEMNDGVRQNANNYPYIGKVVRYKPLDETINTVDCSLVSVAAADISLTESFKQFGLNYNLPMAFATTAEIDNLLTTDPAIYSSGRTTGPKGPGPCQLTILGIDAVIPTIYYNNQLNPKACAFQECIVFTRPDATCPSPIAGGDSGSCLIADFNGVWKIIGLVFAGGSVVDQGTTYYIGVANRIDNVASVMQIQAWDGTVKNYINNNSFQYITIPQTSLDSTKTCNGSTYWQVGLTTDSYPC
jgi:hypothetical protein